MSAPLQPVTSFGISPMIPLAATPAHKTNDDAGEEVFSAICTAIATTPTASEPGTTGSAGAQTPPLHATLDTPSYCYITEVGRTNSETYDMYYKGSLVEGFTRVCHLEGGVGDVSRREDGIGAAVRRSHINNNNSKKKSTDERKPADEPCEENNPFAYYSYEALYDAARSVGRGLCEEGAMALGDRALFFTPALSGTAGAHGKEAADTHATVEEAEDAGAEWFLSCFGLWAYGMGCVVVGCDGHLPALRLAIEETAPRVVLTNAEGLRQIRGDSTLRHQLAGQRLMIVVLGAVSDEELRARTCASPNPHNDDDGPLERVLRFTTVVEEGRRLNESGHNRTMPLPEPDTVAFVVYRDSAKGVVLTHGNLHAAVVATRTRLTGTAATAADSAITTAACTPAREIIAAAIGPMADLAPFILASACLLGGGGVVFWEVMGTAAAPSTDAVTVPSLMLSNGKSKAQLIVAGVRADQHSVVRKVMASARDGDGPRVSLLRYGPHHEQDDKGPYWYSPIAASGAGLMGLRHGEAPVLMAGTELRLRVRVPACYHPFPSSASASADDVTAGGSAEASRSPSAGAGAATAPNASGPILVGDIMLRGPCVSKGFFSPVGSPQRGSSSAEGRVVDSHGVDLTDYLHNDGWVRTGDEAEVLQKGGAMRILYRDASSSRKSSYSM